MSEDLEISDYCVGKEEEEEEEEDEESLRSMIDRKFLGVSGNVRAPSLLQFQLRVKDFLQQYRPGLHRDLTDELTRKLYEGARMVLCQRAAWDEIVVRVEGKAFKQTKTKIAKRIERMRRLRTRLLHSLGPRPELLQEADWRWICSILQELGSAQSLMDGISTLQGLGRVERDSHLLRLHYSSIKQQVARTAFRQKPAVILTAVACGLGMVTLSDPDKPSNLVSAVRMRLYRVGSLYRVGTRKQRLPLLRLQLLATIAANNIVLRQQGHAGGAHGDGRRQSGNQGSNTTTTFPRSTAPSLSAA